MASPIPADGYAIIIGAMKCGTTSLYRYLECHPAICPASRKEPEFFSEHQDHGAKVAAYEDLWDFDPSRHRYAIEASTGYTKHPSEPNVARNIFEYGIRPKFIYVIRNPYQRIVSHYNFMMKHQAWDLAITDPHLISTSDYFLQLEQYRKYFVLADILIVDFADLRDRPADVVARVYDFLGLPHSHFPPHYDVANATPAEIPSEFEKRVRRSRLSGLLPHLPQPLKRLGRRLVPSVPLPAKRTLTPEERQVICEALKDNMSVLQRVYGFDVTQWGFSAG